MDLQALIAQYKTEQDKEKKLAILKKMVALSVDSKDPGLGSWMQELLSYRPAEVPIGALATCPNCHKLMTRSKLVKVPPRGEFHYYFCNTCGIERVVAYLSPYSKGVVHLRDTSIYQDFDELKKFMESRYEMELKPTLESVSKNATDPRIRAFAQYKLASILKTADPEQSQKLFEASLPYYSSLSASKNPELEDILQNLIVFAITSKRPDQALPFIDRLSQYATVVDKDRLLVSCMINKAICLEMMEKFEEAADSFTDAMNMSEEKSFPDLFDQASVRLQALLERVKEKDES